MKLSLAFSLFLNMLFLVQYGDSINAGFLTNLGLFGCIITLINLIVSFAEYADKHKNN